MPDAAEPSPSPSATTLLETALGAIPGGVTRSGQVAMTEAIVEAVGSGRHLLVQAGTGTGKSLAYLAPALTVDGPVVISTATLALQSQLIEKDLPRLSQAVSPLLGREPTFALLKGRHHYVCLAKLENAEEDDPQDALFERTKWLGEAGRLGQQIVRIRGGAMGTGAGGRAEAGPGV